MSEVEETCKKLLSLPGVTGMLIINNEGIPVKTTLNPAVSVQWNANVHEFAQRCKKTMKDLDASQELTMIRIRTNKYELMMAPDKDYMVVVIQEPVQGGDLHK